ncbi:hypothetical protein B0H14DRAFT_2618822 [Mycena olivaceomarginata]|nr:hypothetical protein B0H14DRAFT_2618822 [Mycena olivaceomarginata]
MADICCFSCSGYLRCDVSNDFLSPPVQISGLHLTFCVVFLDGHSSWRAVVYGLSIGGLNASTFEAPQLGLHPRWLTMDVGVPLQWWPQVDDGSKRSESLKGIPRSLRYDPYPSRRVIKLQESAALNVADSPYA